MNHSIYAIAPPNLALSFLLVAAVAVIYWRWSLSVRTVLYATARMVVQLLAVGFGLAYVFGLKNAGAFCLILSAMLAIAGWIALRPLKNKRRRLYGKAFAALVTGCVPTLVLVAGGVLRLDPWYEPRYLIPIAGMIFANAMNAVSLAAERFQAETERGETYAEARKEAFEAGLLPLMNSFFAVGLVSLPGMMTGQILSGVSPLMAVRYQILVMCMLLGASGISSAAYLMMNKQTA